MQLNIKMLLLQLGRQSFASAHKVSGQSSAVCVVSASLSPSWTWSGLALLGVRWGVHSRCACMSWCTAGPCFALRAACCGVHVWCGGCVLAGWGCCGGCMFRAVYRLGGVECVHFSAGSECV